MSFRLKCYRWYISIFYTNVYITPSSVESERLFSVGGHIYESLRTRMKPETAEALIFLHSNLRLLNLSY